MASYQLIGGDQKQYGPVTEEQLRQWILDGRVNPHSQVKAESDAEWRPLSAFPEFAAALAAKSAASGTPPPLPSTMPPIPERTSGLAITSLVLGILGIFTCGITALFGLILGVVALVKAKESRGTVGGSGIALAGVIVSAIFLLMMPIFIALLLPAFATAKQKAQEINCMNNEKQLALAVHLYSADNKDQFPPASTWCDAIRSYVGPDKVFQCPAGDQSRRCNYAYNARLDGLDGSKVKPNTVLIFETEGGWNASGGSELMLNHARHERGRIFVIAFADGHVEAVTGSRLNTLRWDP
jgi:prepilin-type processing-associated H-X9-DG protein